MAVRPGRRTRRTAARAARRAASHPLAGSRWASSARWCRAEKSRLSRRASTSGGQRAAQRLAHERPRRDRIEVRLGGMRSASSTRPTSSRGDRASTPPMRAAPTQVVGEVGGLAPPRQRVGQRRPTSAARRAASTARGLGCRGRARAGRDAATPARSGPRAPAANPLVQGRRQRAAHAAAREDPPDVTQRRVWCRATGVPARKPPCRERSQTPHAVGDEEVAAPKSSSPPWPSSTTAAPSRCGRGDRAAPR